MLTTENLLKMCKALRDSAETGNYLEEPARWLVIDGKNWQEEAKIFAVESEGSGCCVGQVDTGINYLQHSSSFPVLKINGQPRTKNEDPGEHWPRALLYSTVRRLQLLLVREYSKLERRRSPGGV